MPIGVVPWTLRHQVFTVEQVKNTYEKLHALGFDGIESGLGTGVGLSAAEDLALLKEYSLTPCRVYTDLKDPAQAVYHASVMEECAKMALYTLQLDPAAQPVPQYLLDKHYFRKHGPGAYYGQN